MVRRFYTDDAYLESFDFHAKGPEQIKRTIELFLKRAAQVHLEDYGEPDSR